MDKKDFLLIGLAGALVAAGWRLQVSTKQNLQLQTEVAQLKESAARLSLQFEKEKNKETELTEKVKQEAGILEKQRQEDQGAIHELSLKWENEKQILAQLKTKLDQTKASGNGPDTYANADMEKHKSEIRELEEQIASNEKSKKDWTSRENENLKDQKLSLKAQLDQVHAQIQIQEASIRDARAQLAFWRGQKRDPNQAARLQSYENQITEQSQALANLQVQKSGLLQSSQSAAADIKTRAEYEKVRLSEDESKLRDLLRQKKQELTELQSRSGKSQADVKRWQEDVATAQRLYDQQLARVKTAAEVLDQEKRHLANVPSP